MSQNVTKYIKSDIESGLGYLKSAIMNSLAYIEKGGEEIILGKHVPFSLVVECAENRGWIEDNRFDFDYDGWEINCVYFMITNNDIPVAIESCLWKGLETKILVNNYEED